MRSVLRFDVEVSDVDAAVRFYRASFAPESVLETGSGAVELWLSAEGGPVLRVVDERTNVPTRRDRDLYARGRTPRMELVVDDVDAWVDRMAAAGAMVRREREGPARRVMVRDPFGHVWAIAAAEG